MNETDNREPDRQQLERLYRGERGSLMRQVARAGVLFAEAEDIVQDAFLGALGAAGSLAPVQNLSGWIRAAIRNRIIDLWRRDRTRREAGLVHVTEEVFEAIVSEAGLDPLDDFVRDEMAEAVVEAIHALPEPQREVIVGQVFEGVTFKELSERTGIPVETLSARKRAAIRRLGAALRQWIAES